MQNTSKIALKEIDLSKAVKHEHPDIKTDYTLYMVQINEGWFLGPFTRQWYGLNFTRWGYSGCQFDAPGYNSSMWQRILEVSFEPPTHIEDISGHHRGPLERLA